MTQEQVWDNEYKQSRLLAKENLPSSDVVRFVQFLRKEKKIDINNLNVLDLGSGMGRNSFYLSDLGASVIGIEISKTALKIAGDNAVNDGLNIKYIKQSIGEEFPVQDQTQDILLDIVSSNSLSEAEREIYLAESNRVLKKEGYFFVKALCKDGDENAKYLIKNFPGKEKDTYIMPELKVEERVWTKQDITDFYSKFFKVVKLDKKTTYSRMNNRVYKRNFWIMYLQK